MFFLGIFTSIVFLYCDVFALGSICQWYLPSLGYEVPNHLSAHILFIILFLRLANYNFQTPTTVEVKDYQKNAGETYFYGVVIHAGILIMTLVFAKLGHIILF